VIALGAIAGALTVAGLAALVLGIRPGWPTWSLPTTAPA
jgi:hypothetical protein